MFPAWRHPAVLTGSPFEMIQAEGMAHNLLRAVGTRHAMPGPNMVVAPMQSACRRCSPAVGGASSTTTPRR